MSVLGHILGICFREFGGRSLVGLREVFERFKRSFQICGVAGCYARVFFRLLSFKLL